MRASLISFLFLLSLSLQAKVNVTIEGINNNRGVVQLAVWAASPGFPEDYQKATLLRTLKLDQVNLIELPLDAGRYAIAIYHDENEDVVLNRNVFGIPKEGFGFSRNPRIRFGPPKFEDAAFTVRGESSLRIKVNYP